MHPRTLDGYIDQIINLLKYKVLIPAERRKSSHKANDTESKLATTKAIIALTKKIIEGLEKKDHELRYYLVLLDQLPKELNIVQNRTQDLVAEYELKQEAIKQIQCWQDYLSSQIHNKNTKMMEADEEIKKLEKSTEELDKINLLNKDKLQWKMDIEDHQKQISKFNKDKNTLAAEANALLDKMPNQHLVIKNLDEIKKGASWLSIQPSVENSSDNVTNSSDNMYGLRLLGDFDEALQSSGLLKKLMESPLKKANKDLKRNNPISSLDTATIRRKYFPAASLSVTNAAVDGLEVNMDPETFSDFTQYFNQIKETITKKKLDLEWCDLFLMSTPKTKNDFKVSDKNHLYLYKHRDGRFYYFIGETGKLCFLDNNIKDLIQKDEFNQSGNNPVKCENKAICDAILKITSKRDHTHIEKPYSGKTIVGNKLHDTLKRMAKESEPHPLLEMKTQDFIALLVNTGSDIDSKVDCWNEMEKTLLSKVNQGAKQVRLPTAGMQKPTASDKSLQHNMHAGPKQVKNIRIISPHESVTSNAKSLLANPNTHLYRTAYTLIHSPDIDQNEMKKAWLCEIYKDLESSSEATETELKKNLDKGAEFSPEMVKKYRENYPFVAFCHQFNKDLAKVDTVFGDKRDEIIDYVTAMLSGKNAEGLSSENFYKHLDELRQRLRDKEYISFFGRHNLRHTLDKYCKALKQKYLPAAPQSSRNVMSG